MKKIQTTDNQGNEIVSSVMTQFKTNDASKSCKDGTLLTVSFNLRIRNRITPENNTSPNPSKGGEQATKEQTCNSIKPSLFPPFGGIKGGFNTRKQLPLFWRGLGGGATGLLRSARNDAKRETKAESLTSIAWGGSMQSCYVLRRLKSAVNNVSSLRDWLGRVA